MSCGGSVDKGFCAGGFCPTPKEKRRGLVRRRRMKSVGVRLERRGEARLNTKWDKEKLMVYCQMANTHPPVVIHLKAHTRKKVLVSFMLELFTVH